MKVFISGDASAQSVGADDVAEAFRTEAATRGIHLDVVRTGSRGLLWLEPLVELASAGGRHGYGAVRVDDVPALIDTMLAGRPHPSSLGLVDELPSMKRQRRLTFARIGVIDPSSFEDFTANGGLRGRPVAQLSPHTVDRYFQLTK